MSRTVDAIHENGVFTPEQPVELAEKTKVHLVIEKVAPAPAVEDDDPSGWKTIDSLRGIIKDAPPDTAENHDKYLYGAQDE